MARTRPRRESEWRSVAERRAEFNSATASRQTQLSTRPGKNESNPAPRKPHDGSLTAHRRTAIVGRGEGARKGIVKGEGEGEGTASRLHAQK
jgi:hypothetical protein